MTATDWSISPSKFLSPTNSVPPNPIKPPTSPPTIAFSNISDTPFNSAANFSASKSILTLENFPRASANS